MAHCPHCGNLLDEKRPSAQSKAALTEVDESVSSAPDQAAEFDHRGIRLPARTRVGGIIIPQ
jgi:hypothetical protein